MALQSNDLFVVQSQSDSKLYKLKLSDLITEVEGGAGVNFKGSVDLNNAPGDQTPDAITLPGQAGDLYIVESDAAAIAVGWVMQGGETAASQGDRIVYDGDSNDWILIASGSDNAGTVTGVTATLPLKSDGDSVDQSSLFVKHVHLQVLVLMVMAKELLVLLLVWLKQLM